jgi:putative glycosyltransferase (TIGR04372 family)
MRAVFIHIKSYVRVLARFLYLLMNLFYYPLLRFHFRRKIKMHPRTTQLFLLTRMDFGTFPILLHYARCWQEKRGVACIVILTSSSRLVRRMAKMICPEVPLISADHPIVRWIPYVFGRWTVQFFTYNPLYCHIACRWPQALYIFDQPIDIQMKESVSNYIPYFDENLKHPSSRYSPSFLKAYLDGREYLDYRPHVYKDWLDLYYQTNLKLKWPERPDKMFEKLRINQKYIVINVNTKDYKNKNQNVKTAFYPERYNVVIDLLINSGYQVVIQGRSEQPSYRSRNGLIDYSKSAFCSIENDLQLYSRCEFAIVTKTGPELLTAVCNVPILGLNSVEHCSMQPNPRYRFFPKALWSRQSKRFLSWREFLLDPSFFDLGPRANNPEIEYRDMEEAEMVRATVEFLPLLSRSFPEWLNYTKNQQEFKSNVTPLHCDLYNIKGVPCESYFSLIEK